MNSLQADVAQQPSTSEENETKTLPPIRLSFGLGLLILLLLIAILLPVFVDSTYYMSIFIQVLMMAFFTTAWGLVGQTGQLSFGHVAFIGVGAYTNTILWTQFGVNPWINLLFGGLAAVAFGAIIGIPSLRLRGVYFALVTLAFAFILQIFVNNTFEVGPLWLGASPGIQINLVDGGNAPYIFQFATKTPYYYIILIMLVGLITLSYIINKTRMGYYWTAIRDDPDAAEALGINVAKYRIRAFLLSCFLTGMGGVFYAQYLLSVDPRRVLDLGFSIEIVTLGVVGGWQSVFGPLLGSLVLTPIGELVRAEMYQVPQLFVILYGSILILFILFLPDGLNKPVMRLIRRIDRSLKRNGNRQG